MVSISQKLSFVKSDQRITFLPPRNRTFNSRSNWFDNEGRKNGSDGEKEEEEESWFGGKQAPFCVISNLIREWR